MLQYGVIAYLDCVSGIAGNMVLGALLDLGVPKRVLHEAAAKVAFAPFTISARRVEKNRLRARLVQVRCDDRAARRYVAIRRRLERAKLPDTVKAWSSSAFEKLAAAEAQVHGESLEDVHFHEVGQTDAIVDIVGSAAGLAHLGVDKIVCSAVQLGGGRAQTAHGAWPVPGPAALEILKGKPVYGGEVDLELTTPTGAAIAAAVSSDFGPLPPLTLRKVGYGAGRRDLPWPNVLRILLGEEDAAQERWEAVVELVTCVDDVPAELLGFAQAELLRAGALDVFLKPVVMKKSRPGTEITVLSSLKDEDDLRTRLFDLTRTLGVRRRLVTRVRLHRTREPVRTQWGTVVVKKSFREGKLFHVKPEFSDCEKLAQKHGVPPQQIWGEALRLGHPGRQGV